MKEVCWFVYRFHFLPTKIVNKIVKIYTVINVLEGRIWKYRADDFSSIWQCWGI